MRQLLEASLRTSMTHIWSHFCIFLLALSSCAAQGNPTEYRLICYTCMSENVPQISKDIMRQTINIPDYAESRACNDPFMQGDSALANGIRMEPCDSACIKVVSENKYLRVVLRGCLNKLYSPGYLGFPLPDAQGGYEDTCDSQRQTSTGIGETVTDTCICTSNYCNHALTTSPSILALILLLITILALTSAQL